MRPMENSLLFWYPKLKGTLTMTPRTEIVELKKKNSELTPICDGDFTPLKEQWDEILQKARKIGYPLFMRTDEYSGKHNWKNTCFVEKEEDLKSHIKQLFDDSFMADMMGLPLRALVFRKYIPMQNLFKAFRGEMPVNPEIRAFFKDHKLVCWHWYWIKDAIEKGSGGDPMLLSYETHKKIVNHLFKRCKTVCKIIVNPKSIKDSKILSLYDWIGVSVNNLEELILLGKNCTRDIKDKTTVITNFNNNNVFLFDKIADGLKKNVIKAWQIQFTMDKKDGNGLLYKNADALAYLQGKVNNTKGIEIIPADNMNSNECSAGINSCGIDCDGNVMPCLSMFSWCTDKNKLFVGNLLKRSLKDIWENEFKECRFKRFKCCKDVCGRKTIDIKDDKSPFNPFKIQPIKPKKDKKYPKHYPEPWPKPEPEMPRPMPVIMYGVSPNDRIVVLYGISPRRIYPKRNDNVRLVYGVQGVSNKKVKK